MLDHWIVWLNLTFAVVNAWLSGMQFATGERKRGWVSAVVTALCTAAVAVRI